MRSVTRPSTRSSGEHGKTSRLECVTRRFYNPLSITILGALVSFVSRHHCGRRRRRRERRKGGGGGGGRKHHSARAEGMERPNAASWRRIAFVSLSPFLPAFFSPVLYIGTWFIRCQMYNRERERLRRSEEVCPIMVCVARQETRLS